MSVVISENEGVLLQPGVNTLINKYFSENSKVTKVGPTPQQPDKIPEITNLDGMWTEGVSSPSKALPPNAPPAERPCPPSVLQALDKALGSGAQTGRVRPGEAASSLAS